MGLEFGKISSANSQYDDNGNLLTNMITAIESGSLTKDIDGTENLVNVYDYDPTTYLTLANGASKTKYLKWDFHQKNKFKNVYVGYTITGSEAQTTWIYLQGSQNNTDWTTIDSASTVGTLSGNLLATDVNYRYIRVYGTTAATAAGDIKVYNVKGVL